MCTRTQTLIVFSGGWVDPYSACAEEGGVPLARLYFLIALLLGFFVIMNLFVSIILEALAEFEEEMEEAEEQEEAEKEAEAGGAAQPLPPPVQRGVTSAGGEVEGTDDDNDDDDEELHPLRAFSRSVIKRPETEFGLVMLIGASSIALAIDTPTLDPDSDLGVGLVVANYVFTLIFTLEACLRFLAYDPVRRAIYPLMLSARSSVLPIIHAIIPSRRPHALYSHYGECPAARPKARISHLAVQPSGFGHCGDFDRLALPRNDQIRFLAPHARRTSTAFTWQSPRHADNLHLSRKGLR